MAKLSESESAAARSSAPSTCSGYEMSGRISKISLVQLDLDNGSTVIAPEEILMKPGTVGTIGDIVDIFCKLTGWCGGGGGGGSGGGKVCYKTIIGTDGTITITPVPCPKQSVA